MDKTWPQQLTDTAFSVLFYSARLAVVTNVSVFLILYYCFTLKWSGCLLSEAFGEVLLNTNYIRVIYLLRGAESFLRS